MKEARFLFSDPDMDEYEDDYHVDLEGDTRFGVVVVRGRAYTFFVDIYETITNACRQEGWNLE